LISKEVTHQTLSRFRIGIAGHVVLDRVRGPNVSYDSVGGVPTYAGLAVASLGHEAFAISVVGEDGRKALEGLRALGRLDRMGQDRQRRQDHQLRDRPP
jgi:hypothetical protein